MINFYKFHIILFFIFIQSFSSIYSFGQCDTCNSVITYYIDLSSTPDSVWLSPDTQRDGVCCGNPGECIRFIVTTNPSSNMLAFAIATPPIPPGQFYQYDCGPLVSAGEPLCISGTGPHCIIYCKPGADLSQYTITASQSVFASPNIAINDAGCTGLIWATGLDPASMIWNSVFPGAYGAYNSYLDCTVGCDTVGVTAQAGYPPYIDFEVSGNLTGPCNFLSAKDTVRVYFIDDFFVDIFPDSAVICFGAVNAVITANATGGAPPYSYLWNTAETTQSISVGVGTYWVEVHDTSVCGPGYDTVVVTQHLAPITANAGPDQIVCVTNPNVSLNGNVTVATGGVWSNGNGSFLPDSATLNATYIPTVAEIAAGFVTLILTTTGNGGCPAVSDIMTVIFLPEPIVDAGPDQTVCANNSMVSLTGTISGGASQGIWTTSGSGVFAPYDTSLNTTYTPSDADTAAGSVVIVFSSTDGCTTISDTMIITIYPAPYVYAGPDQFICENDFDVNLAGSVSGGASTGIWTSLGSGSFSPNNTALNAIYTMSSGDTAAGSVVLILTSTNNGNCNPVNDTMVIIILDVPIVDAGPDQIICSYEAVSLNGIVIGGSGTGIWTTPNGTGTFDPDHTDLNATYNPGINDYINGTVTLVLTSTNNGTCLPASDNLVISVQPTPVVFAGPNQIVCANNSVVSLNGTITNGASEGVWTSNGTGIFSPDDTSLITTYIPSDADTANGFITLTLTATNGCDSVSDNMNIIITPAPYVNAGPDLFICHGDTIVSLNGIISAGANTGEWSSLGTGYFSPLPTDLGADYILSPVDTAAGTVTLVLTSTNNGNCNPVTDTMVIAITTIPTVDAGPDQTICGNMIAALNGIVLDGSGTGIWSTTNGSGYFSPSDTSLITSYIPSPNDTITGSVTIVLTATDACMPGSDELILTILPAPYVNAGPDQVVCIDNPNVSLTGVVSSWAAPGLWTSSGSGTFLPDNSTLNATYVPSASDITNGSVNIILMSTNNGLCDPGYDTMLVTILPLPVTDAGPDQTICANNVASLVGQITGGSGTGIWSTFDGTGVFSPSDTLLNASYIPSANDTVLGSITLTLTSTNNGSCSASSDDVIISFSPAPIVNAGADQLVCENNADVNLSGTVIYATGGIWSTMGGGTFFPNNTSLNTTYIPSITDIIAGEVILVLTSTGNGTCLPETDTMLVTITPAPIVDAGADKYICEGTTSASLSGIVSGITTTGQWSTLGSGTFFPSPNLLNVIYNLSSGDVTAGSVPIILTSTNNLYCNPVTDTMVIYITEIPTSNAGPDQIVCANNSDVLLNGVVTGTTGSGVWSALNGTGIFSPDDTSLSTTYLPSDADTAQGYVTIIITATNACIPVTDTMEIIITPAPQVYAGTDQLVCDNVASISLSGVISGGATEGIWTTTGSGTFVPSNTDLNTSYSPSPADTANGEVYIILTSTNNGTCNSENDTVQIEFGVSPFADFIFPDTICLNEIVNFINTSTISNGSIVLHEWNFGGSNVFYTQDAFMSFTLPGIYDVILIETSDIGCTDTVTYPVNVNPLPIPSFSYSSNCTYDSIYFIDTSTPVIQWQWIFGNGNTSSIQNPEAQIYSLPGDYDVSLTVVDANACSNTVQQEIEVYATPNVGINFHNFCVGEIAVFTDISTVINDTIIDWLWDFGDGASSTDQHPTHTYISSGTFDVILWASTDHCSNSDTITLTIEPIPDINILPSFTQGCNLLTVDFINNTTGAVTYHWDFGDGSTSIEISPSHTFINTGLSDIIYPVELIAYSSTGCIDTLIIDITIHPTPQSAFISDAVPGCSPLDVNFLNYSNGANSYLWDFGDGTFSTDTNPSNTYVNDTSYIIYYQVILTATSQYGCVDSSVIYITVFPNPDIDFTIDPDSSCHPDIVELSASPGAFSYQWIYGDGMSETVGSTAWHIYTNTSGSDSIYTVQLITTTYFSCIDTTEHTIVVHPIPTADFDISIISGCTVLDVILSNHSGGATNYYWNFGDGDSIISNLPLINHTFVNDSTYPISYNITLIAENDYGCTDVATNVVNVYPATFADFSVSDTTGCSPFNIDFTNLSIGGDSYLWDFGDGTFSTNTNPLHTFVNTGAVDSIFTVMLISTSSYLCKDTTYFSITVHPKPEALFGLNNSSGCSPFNSIITNNSIGATAYFWDFGDGDTLISLDTSIVHTYSNLMGLPVSYELYLIAENIYGCVDTVMQTITVYPEITSNFTVDTIGCSPLDADFVNQSLGGASYQWYFGDGNSSTLTSPSHTYVNITDSIQIHTASLITYSSYLCTDTSYIDVTVFPAPQAIFSINEIVSCSPFDAIINNASVGATIYNWDFGDGNTSNISDTIINYYFENVTNNTVTFDIQLYVENDYGCSSFDNHYVTLYPNLTAMFVHDSASCSPFEVDFINISVGADTYYWTFGDGATSSNQNVSHTFTNSTINDVIYTTTLDIESNYGCTNTYSSEILVYATPFAEFYANPTYQVYPSTTITINNMTVGPWDFFWDFGNDTTSSLVNPGSIDYDTWGEYTIFLTANSPNCEDTLSHTIIIEPPLPTASFTPSAQGCAPLTVQFVNHSQYENETMYEWTFGDGGESTQENPLHVFYTPGIWAVSLKVTGDGGSDISTDQYITVYQNPIAFFSYTPALVSIPDEAAYFFNQSDNADFYLWDFGDKTPLDTAFNPIHYYQEEGTYDVTLIAWTEDGCYDTLKIEEAVVAASECQIIFPNAFTPNNAGPNGGLYPKDDIYNDVFYPKYKGIIEFTMEIFNRWGELIFVSNDIKRGWDGYYRDQLCKQDVYIWKAKWTCINDQKYTEVGDVLLLR